MDLLIAIGVGISLPLIILLLFFALGRPALTVGERIEVWFTPGGEKEQKEGKKTLFFRAGNLPAWKAGLGRNLAVAGIPLEPDEALMAWAGLMILFPLLLFFLKGILAAFAGIVFSAFFPVLVLRFRKAMRLKMFDSQLSELLELLTSGLRAGFSLNQALQHASLQIAPPLGPSLQVVNAEIMMGLDLEEALIRWQNRQGSMDVEMVVSAILIQREVGGNLAELMDNISRLLRDRQEAMSEMKALTAQGKMEGVVVTLLPIALAVVINMMNPGYLDPLFQTPQGRVILSVAIVSGIIGSLLIRKITNIRY